MPNGETAGCDAAMGNNGSGRVAGKVAVVTGAGRGIGRATAERLAAEGACIVGIDMNQEDLDATQAAISKAGNVSAMLCGDATEEAITSQLVEFAADHFGRIDILVNNIGTTRAGRIWELKGLADAGASFFGGNVNGTHPHRLSGLLGVSLRL